MSSEPLVSAVIPTYNRPNLVVRAVKTALSQTHSNMEVVVVVDGPDDSTSKALGAIADSRIQIITLQQHLGGSGARNAGVQAATGEWIAFLDDDDEWLPSKIECQIEIARCSRYRIPVVSSQIIARTPRQDYIWPRRFPLPDEHISDYLFSRKSLFQGEGFARHFGAGVSFSFHRLASFLDTLVAHRANFIRLIPAPPRDATGQLS